MDAYSIIRKPVITEKSTILKDVNNQVCFVVDIRANKVQIKEAVENIFDVNVESVSTMRCKGKNRRMGKHIGKQPDWKKAIVTLKDGDRIEFFEGV